MATVSLPEMEVPVSTVPAHGTTAHTEPTQCCAPRHGGPLASPENTGNYHIVLLNRITSTHSTDLAAFAGARRATPCPHANTADSPASTFANFRKRPQKRQGEFVNIRGAE
jgi:hypothetical protein